MSVSLARRILAERLLPPEVLHRALLESLRSATPLLEILIGARRDLAPALSDLLVGRHGQAPASWQPDRALVAQLPPGMCERLLAFPIRAGADGEVEVAAADPSDPHIVREFVAHLGRTVIMVASPLSQIFQIAGVRIVPPLPEYVSVSDRPIPLVRRSVSKPRVEPPPPSSAADYEPISPMPSRPVTAPPPAELVQAPRPTPSAATVASRPLPSAAELSSAATLAQPGRAPSKDAPSTEKAEKSSSPGPAQRTAAAQTRVSVVPRSPDASQATTTRVPTSRGLQSPLAASSSAPPSSEAPRPQVSTAPKAPVVATKPATATTSKTSVTPAPAPVAAVPAAAKVEPAAAKVEPVAAKVEPVAAKPATAAGKATGMTPAPGAVRSMTPEAPRPILAARADGAAPDAVPMRAPAAQFRPAVPLGSKAPAPTERRPVAPQISKAPEHPEVVQPAAPQVSKAPAPAPTAEVSRPSAAQVPKAPAPAPKVSRPSAAQAKAPAPAVSRSVVPRLSLADVEQRLRAAESPDDVARALGTGGGSGAIVFSVKPDQFVVRAVGGQDERPELSVPREGPSALRVAAEQDEYLGPLFDAPAHEKLTQWLEAGVPVFVASVKLRDKVALVLMLSAKTDEDGTRTFGRKMAELAARALEDLIVRRKRTSHP